MLKNGDKCHVRLKSGEIVEAIYKNRVGSFSLHEVLVKDTVYVAVFWGVSHFDNWECRFVCMTGMNKGKDNGNSN